MQRSTRKPSRRLKSPKQNAKEIISEEQRAEIYRLAKAGISYAKIAEKLNLSKAKVGRAVLKARSEAQAEITASIADIKAEILNELELIAEIERRNRVLLYQSDPKIINSAALTLLKVSDQRCKLRGLYSPTRIEATGKDGAPLQVAAKLDYSTLDDEKLAQLRELVGEMVKGPVNA